MENNVLLSPVKISELETIVRDQVRIAISEATKAASLPDKDKLLTIEETAEMLSVAIPTVYGYVYKKEIPYMKRRGRLYFDRTEILGWVKSSRHMTREEIRQVAAESLNR